MNISFSFGGLEQSLVTGLGDSGHPLRLRSQSVQPVSEAGKDDEREHRQQQQGGDEKQFDALTLRDGRPVPIRPHPDQSGQSFSFREGGRKVSLPSGKPTSEPGRLFGSGRPFDGLMPALRRGSHSRQRGARLRAQTVNKAAEPAVDLRLLCEESTVVLERFLVTAEPVAALCRHLKSEDPLQVQEPGIGGLHYVRKFRLQPSSLTSEEDQDYRHPEEGEESRRQDDHQPAARNRRTSLVSFCRLLRPLPLSHACARSHRFAMCSRSGRFHTHGEPHVRPFPGSPGANNDGNPRL